MKPHLTFTQHPFPGPVALISASGDLALSQLPTFTLTVASPHWWMNTPWTGQPVAFTVQDGYHSPLHVHGFILHMSGERLLGEHGWHEYTITLGTVWSTLAYSRHPLVLNDTTLPQAVQALCAPSKLNKIQCKLHRPYAERPYRLLDGESTLDDLQYLFANEGVYWYLSDFSREPTLVVSDFPFPHTELEHPLVCRPDGSYPGPAFVDWHTQVHWIPNHTHYRQALDTQQSMVQAKHEALAPRVVPNYRYPSESPKASRAELERLIQQTQRHQEMQACTFTAQGPFLPLLPGVGFTLRDHPDANQNGPYWVKALRFTITDYQALGQAVGQDVPDPDIDIEIDGMSANTPFVPPLPEPRVTVPQLATVVGPPHQTVHTDPLGRVRAQFHWQSKQDLASTAWLPVRQPWAGPYHGFQGVPRVGQVGLIDFEAGQGDRPLWLGTLATQAHPMPFTPHTTPHRQGWQSRTSGSTDPNDGHRVLFDDDPNHPTVALHSSKDFKLTSQGDSTHQVGGDSHTTVEGKDALLQSGEQWHIEAKEAIHLQCGQSVLRIDQSGITLQSDSIHFDNDTVPFKMAPKASPKAVMQSLSQQLTPSHIPKAAQTKPKPTPNNTPIVEVIYLTGEQALAFLTPEEQTALNQAEAPLRQAAQQLVQAQQAAQGHDQNKEGVLTPAAQAKVQHAREALNKTLKALGGAEKVAEFVRLNSEQRWAYVDNALLAKLKLKSYVHVDDEGNIHYRQYAQVRKTSTRTTKVDDLFSDKAKHSHQHKVSKVDIAKAKAALLNTELGEQYKQLAGFSTGEYQGHLDLFGKTLQNQGSFKAKAATSWVSLQADGQDQLLRYTAGASAHSGYDPKTKTLALNANAEANLDVFSGKLHATAKLPANQEGYHLVMEELDLGYFQAIIKAYLYGEAGASVVACGNVHVTANPGVRALPPGQVITQKENSPNWLHGRLTPGDKNGEAASGKLAAFAGVNAGCTMDGIINWRSPETVMPIQNPNKNSEMMGGLQGRGEPTWKEFADLTLGVEADLGIGANVGFTIAYTKGRFVVGLHAKVVFGGGAGGHIQIVIDKDHIEEFVLFVYHQIKNYNFHNTELFSTEDVFIGFVKVLAVAVWADIKLTDLAHFATDKVEQWLSHELTWLYHRVADNDEICKKIVQLANNILSKPVNAIACTPPEVKGRWIYHLSHYLNLFGGQSKKPAQAIQRILSLIQSAHEFVCVLKNYVPINAKGPLNSAAEGQYQLLQNLTNENLDKYVHLQTETLLATQDHYNDAMLAVLDNEPDAMMCKLNSGALNVIDSLYHCAVSLRETALVNQAANANAPSEGQLRKLREAAKAHIARINHPHYNMAMALM